MAKAKKEYENPLSKEDFVDGLENAPEAFMGLLKGKNFGKLIVRTSEDPTR